MRICDCFLTCEIIWQDVLCFQLLDILNSLSAVAEIYPDKVCYIQDFEIESALFLMQGNRAAKIQIRFDTNNNQFFISSKTAHGEEGWSRNAKGSIREMRILCTPCFENIGEIRNRCQPELDPKLLYLQAQQWGLNYGPLFRNVSCFWRPRGAMQSRSASVNCLTI
ncbi:MAG: polyketide synthase dehydratase domain-containing protein [Hahellaceae bacterium]|nr:polyketide synthase dehydratase domain-containing protein [Hahellaceae bacterium]